MDGQTAGDQFVWMPVSMMPCKFLVSSLSWAPSATQKYVSLLALFPNLQSACLIGTQGLQVSNLSLLLQ